MRVSGKCRTIGITVKVYQTGVVRLQTILLILEILCEFRLSASEEYDRMSGLVSSLGIGCLTQSRKAAKICFAPNINCNI